MNEKLFEQLAMIRQRLVTFPFSNHEAICIRDCMDILIRTIAGEVIEEEISVAGGVLRDGQNIRVDQLQQQGGKQLAEGVVEYPAPRVPMNQPGGIQTQVVQQGGALIDIEAALGKKPAGSTDGLPEPLPGSIMYQAMHGENANNPQKVPEVSEAAAMAEMESLLGGNDSPAPNPSETKLVVTPSPEPEAKQK